MTTNGHPPLARVAICTPCQDMVCAGYTYDLARLVATMARQAPEIEITIHQNRGTIIPQQRATLVHSAREAQATHILWVDSDMRFPPDTLIRLLEHGQPIVAANYPTRRAPILPTAEHRELGYLFTPADASGLAEVTHCGMGLMLTAMQVFDATPEPWFIVGYNRRDREYSGEDFFFCSQAKQAGFPTLIDQALSVPVRHTGQMEYTNAHAVLTRDTYNAIEPTKPVLVT